VASFPATIRLARSTIAIDGKDVPLTAGIAVTIEIKTRHRRAIVNVPSSLRPSIDRDNGCTLPSTAHRYAHAGFFP
jgi:hypothetical protein